MINGPKNPSTEPAPIADSEAPPQHPDDDHKVAENPPIDDPDYQSEESFE